MGMLVAIFSMGVLVGILSLGVLVTAMIPSFSVRVTTELMAETVSIP
jgi:hypothetical protein